MVRGKMHGRWGKGDSRHQRRAMVGTEEGWGRVQENEAWRVGVSADIGCVSMHGKHGCGPGTPLQRPPGRCHGMREGTQELGARRGASLYVGVGHGHAVGGA